MTMEQAAEVIAFLERYNNHFADLVAFLKEKHLKVLADDLVWLHDSLQQEQRLSMAGTSLETKRLELLASVGYPDAKSSVLVEAMPEECRQRFLNECEKIEKAIDEIKSLNEETLDLIEKKLEVAEEVLEKKGNGVGNKNFYSSDGTKIRMNNPDDEIIGKM